MWSKYRSGFFNETRLKFTCPYCDYEQTEDFINYDFIKQQGMKHIHEEHPNEVKEYKRNKIEQERA